MLKKFPLFCICILCCLPFSATAEPFTGRVTGSKVRLRTQPNLEGHVVKETNSGDMYVVTHEENGFYAIKPPKGTKGYVFRTFVLDGMIEGERVNVRLYPDIEAPILTSLSHGEKVEGTLSSINNKWYEIELPPTAHFYIAKEYVEQCGPVEMLAQVEARHLEATHHLSAAFLLAQAEIQKPFEEIDLDTANRKFDQIVADFSDVPDVVQRANEIGNFIKDAYIQKKIAFLESKAAGDSIAALNPEHVEKLTQLGLEIKTLESDVSSAADAAIDVLGLSTLVNEETITDKMKIWLPLEEACYHLWVAVHGEMPMEQFYDCDKDNAVTLSGIIETYDRAVKNRPGDYLLKNDNVPVAFLYSTRVDLQKLVGKKVVITGSVRPKNNFAFPAYFVHSVE